MTCSRFQLVIPLLALLLGLPGCTVGLLLRVEPESHFVYPNSNVKELGPVSAKMTGDFGLFMPSPLRTSASDEAIYRLALQGSPGADLIVNYVATSTVRTLANLVFWTTHQLEGTAAEMTVGKQQLR